MQLRVGTSGFSYKEWRGPFYPPDLPQARFLAHYAERLSTVEINNTFYRMPKPDVLRRWAEEVPDGFTFVIKAPQRITHVKRLKDTEEPVLHLWQTVQALGSKLGPILFQLAPNAKRNLERLAAFVDVLPPGLRAVFEFRHESWIDDEVFAVLRSAGAAWCTADVADDPDAKDAGASAFAALRSTTDWGYLRLRREDYDEAALDAWVARIRGQDWKEAFVFFKHEDAGAGPRLARAFRARFDA